MLIVCGLGAGLGIAIGIGYAAIMIHGLKTWWIGAISQPFLELRVDWLSLLIGAASGVVICVLTIWWSLRRTVFPWSTSTFETGAPLRTGFALPGLWWLPLVQFRWAWSSPDSAEVERVVERGRLRERVRLGRRGIYAGVTRRIIVQDAFGLARIAFRQHQSGPIEVLPHLGGIRRLPVLTSLTGGEEHPHPMGLEDGDRVELRRYVPGDSARFIHWKVFGRTRKLMVRTPERALSRARRTVAYLVTGPNDEAAAAAARAAIEEEALGVDWRFGADGTPSATSDRTEAIHKVMQSADFDGRSGSGLRQFLAEVDPEGPAALILFAPPSIGPWIDELRGLTMRRYGRVRVVVAVDAVHEAHERSSWKRWLLHSESASGVARRDLEAVGRALSQLRCQVVVIDRVSGRVLGDGMHVAVAPRRAA